MENEDKPRRRKEVHGGQEEKSQEMVIKQIKKDTKGDQKCNRRSPAFL